MSEKRNWLPRLGEPKPEEETMSTIQICLRGDVIPFPLDPSEDEVRRLLERLYQAAVLPPAEPVDAWVQAVLEEVLNPELKFDAEAFLMSFFPDPIERLVGPEWYAGPPEKSYV